MIDIITIVHNDQNAGFARTLKEGLDEFEEDNYRLIIRDNTRDNVGFARGCNIGAKEATTDIIGFVNPDVIVEGKFIDTVEKQFLDENLVITGCTFRQPGERYNHIGLKAWVCGAALFVRKDWFDSVGGFFEGYVWSWEETDLCRLAQEHKRAVRPIVLPLKHDRSHVGSESQQDKDYKRDGMRIGKELYYERWR